MAQFRMVVEQAIDLGTFRAIKGSPRAIDKAVLQEEERITFHELQRPRPAAPGKDSVRLGLDCHREPSVFLCV